MLSRYLRNVIELFLLFTIVSADGNNPMSSPAAGELIPVGIPFTITWTPGTPGPVKIVLQDNSEDITPNITSSTPNTGSYTWTPQASLASINPDGGFFMRICDLTISDCTYTYAGRFNFDTGTSTATGTATSTIGSSVSSPISSQASISLPVSSAHSTLTLPSSANPSTASSASGSKVSSVTSSTSSNTASSSMTTAASPSPTTSPGGLSTTAKVAIGVVLAVVGTTGLLIGGFLLYRKGQRSAQNNKAAKPQIYTAIHEKDSDHYNELPTANNTNELPATSRTRYHELDSGGNWPKR